MKWNKISSGKMPKDDETVLVWNKIEDSNLLLAWYEEEFKSFYSLFSSDSFPIVITHWMRLPALPED